MTSTTMASDLAREALEPFANVTRDWTDENGWTNLACQGDRIRDWFGPSDFRRARTAYDAIGSGVKALEWTEPRTGPDEYKVIARLGAFEGCYEIDPPYPSMGGKFKVTRSWEINPFAWALTLDEAKAAAQSDFERRVLSCHSPVAVEEVDAKAVAWRDMASAPKDGTYILASGLDFGTGPRRHYTVCLCLEGTGTFVEAEEGEELTYLDAWVPLPGATLLSTHTAAGAGPVGEAVAWLFEREGDPTSPKISLRERLTDAAKMAGWTERPLYARPVDEPGEVVAEADAERLREAWSDFEDSHDLVREGHRHIRYRECREAFEAAWPDAAKATAIAAAALAARPGEVERSR